MGMEARGWEGYGDRDVVGGRGMGAGARGWEGFGGGSEGRGMASGDRVSVIRMYETVKYI